MSVNYGIMRMQKISNLGAMQGIANHNFRKKMDMKSLQHIGKKRIIEFVGSGSYVTDFEEAKKLHTVKGKGPHIQKNCCYGWDIVLTATSLNGVDLKEWVEKNMLWLGKTFGVKNVRSLVLHADEKTPHLHGYVTPFHYSDKMHRYVLGAKHWTGGFNKMRQLQDSYYEDVSSHFGFARGVPVEESHNTHVQPETFRKQKESERKSFMEWFDNLSDEDRQNWLLNAQARLKVLDANSKTFEYYRKKLNEIEKEHPKLLVGMRAYLNNSQLSILKPTQPFNVIETSHPTKGISHQVTDANPRALIQTAFCLGAIMGAMIATGSDKQPSHENPMSLIDFYMRAWELSFEEAQIVAKDPESEKAKKIMRKGMVIE